MTEPNASDPNVSSPVIPGPTVPDPNMAAQNTASATAVGQVVMGTQALDDADRREVLWRTYQAVQAEQLALGTLPDVDRTVLSPLGRWLALLGAVQLGLLVASFSVFSIFVVTRMILHIDFSRYLGV